MQDVHKAISTTHAPEAIGPYSQARCYGNLVYTSGQIPLDPISKKLVIDSIEAQTHQVMQNLKAVLEAAGSGLDQTIKATIFLTDLSQFAKVNAVYGSYFQVPYPARSTVQVQALPLGSAIEIELVAAKPL